MKKHPRQQPTDRRHFLKSAALVGGAAAATLGGGNTADAVAAPDPQPAQRAANGTGRLMAPEADPPAENEVLTVGRPGSDFMVDVLKSLGFEYIAANAGSSFRGLHESLVNYGGNKAPEFITCCHEESSVAIAHGYASVEGKPMMVMAHSTVGLQHASMAVYNAYSGGMPVFLLLGNTVDATMRRPGAEWYHSVIDATAMVRDYVKWDDLPGSLTHFAESCVRAYKVAMTPPTLPVVIVADTELQENPIPAGMDLRVPKLTVERAPQGDSGSVAEAAKWLVAAEHPVIVAGDAVSSDHGMALLVDLAETLQAPVIDQGGGFPSQHALNQSLGGRGLIQDADVILALESDSLWGTLNSMRDQVHRPSRSVMSPKARLIGISTRDFGMRGGYQNIQRYAPVDLSMAADAEQTLPALIDAVKKLMTDDRRRVAQERGAKLASAHHEAFESARRQAVFGWDASPISVNRLCVELWQQIKDEDWALAGDRGGPRGRPGFMWNYTKRYQRTRGGDAVGLGFTAPSSVGAALAHKKHGRVPVCFQTDGDLMYTPGVLWTAAHHRIPLLTVMHNNRAYHQEVMHLQRMSTRRERDLTTAPIGCVLWDPYINYAKLAQGLGVYAEGPIENPKDLAPALKRAVEVVKKGEPALVDVVTQPR